MVIDGLEEGAGDADRELLGELLQTTVIPGSTCGQHFMRAPLLVLNTSLSLLGRYHDQPAPARMSGEGIFTA